ncbi:MAG TPA: hypothetical protein VFM39_01725, partial [bacterium]|nr:hypothetical protein [bacterium]
SITRPAGMTTSLSRVGTRPEGHVAGSLQRSPPDDGGGVGGSGVRDGTGAGGVGAPGVGTVVGAGVGWDGGGVGCDGGGVG